MSDVITELANEANDKAAEIARLRAENAKLREQVDAAHMSRLLTENENERLRELVRDMWHEGMCECDECGACAECEYHFPDRMRELGVD